MIKLTRCLNLFSSFSALREKIDGIEDDIKSQLNRVGKNIICFEFVSKVYTKEIIRSCNSKDRHYNG
jgi:hypothetical protein